MKWTKQIKLAISKKTKASVIQFTLVLSIIIALFASSLLLLNTYTSKSVNKTIETLSSFDLLNNTLLDPDYINEENDLQMNYLTFTEKQWGILKIIHVTIDKLNNHVSKYLLVGSRFLSDNNLALSLNKANQLFTLTNIATIEGQVYVPGGRIIKQNNIYKNNSIIANKVDNSLFQLNETLIDSLSEMLDYGNFKTNSIFNFYSYSRNKEKLVNAFNKKTIVLYSDGDINLNNISIKGNFIIQSGGRITIKRSATIDNCLLFASEIEVENNVSSSFQGFATHAIHIGENCNLIPYCFLATIGDNCHILLKSNCTVYGGLMLINTSKQYTTDTQILIENNCLIKGLVYSNTYVEHKGTIHGALISNKLICKYKGTNENQLSEGSINSSALKSYYPSPFIIKGYTENITYEILNSNNEIN